jgi:hypothetical protein
MSYGGHAIFTGRCSLDQIRLRLRLG